MANVTEVYGNDSFISNVTESTPPQSNSPWDDATWILTSAFIIFTMQSGFGLLESGMASRKNEVNIMLKNVVDVVFGGITYWSIGYGLTFGDDAGANGFTGVGYFFLNPDGEHIGTIYSKFVFQASFATTATTIVSGAMAERTKLMAYIVFSLFNTFVYSFPAHWVWADEGWLKKLYVVDVAGVGPVHLVGGVTALIAAVMLKPRRGRFVKESRIYQHIPSSNPVNTLLGLFMLWWGWLGFNCGSTFGISGGKWKLATRAAATTILSSCGGGITAFIISYVFHKRKYIIPLIVNGILGSLVSVSAICAVTTTWAAVIIGSVGAIIAALSDFLLFKLKIDDPVGASSVHLFCSIWGLLCCGIFAQKDQIQGEFNFNHGLLWGGGWYLLGVQTLSVVTIILWSAVMSVIILKAIDLTIGLRVSTEEEIVGADFFEHNIMPPDGVMPILAKHFKTKRSSNKNKDESNDEQVVADEKLCFCFIKKKTIVAIRRKRGTRDKDEDETKDDDIHTEKKALDILRKHVKKGGKEEEEEDVISEITQSDTAAGMQFTNFGFIKDEEEKKCDETDPVDDIKGD
ncbi:putative ammonium transporter 3 [Haliotis rufescens]|uniref:putative ammonium transporter 3 n=1 Tax=Haliotis rufescens TaxID=6454 RepID=UPI00201EB696|nr:putative ammonium transporter 3 [Haliotis rufescens]